jgi:hypothetical protein
MNTLAVRKLKAFGTQIRDVANRDLGLLRIIEQTLDMLDVHCGQLRQLNQDADQFIAQLHVTDLSFVGADADLVRLFEGARDSVAKAYDIWSAKHLCAVNAPELSDDDGVVEGYAYLLSEVADLHDKLNTLAWIIREQEAEQDKAMPGVFSNVDELFSSMGV